jgi:hypothetical protein
VLQFAQSLMFYFQIFPHRNPRTVLKTFKGYCGLHFNVKNWQGVEARTPSRSSPTPVECCSHRSKYLFAISSSLHRLVKMHTWHFASSNSLQKANYAFGIGDSISDHT